MERVFTEVNNGVYRCGFAGSQEAYDAAYDRLWTALDWLEERLADRRYLMGDAITEADVRLFTTLVRFDAVYHGHFKCNRQQADRDAGALGLRARPVPDRRASATPSTSTRSSRTTTSCTSDINPTQIVPRGPRPRLAGPSRTAAAERPSALTPRLGAWDTTTGTPPAGRRTAPGCGWCWRSPSSCWCSRSSAALVTGSLALLADAGHMATDAAAVVLALGASYVATPARPARARPSGCTAPRSWPRWSTPWCCWWSAATCSYAGISPARRPDARRRRPDGRVRAGRPGRQRASRMAVLNRSDTGSLNLRGAANEVLADLLGLDARRARRRRDPGLTGFSGPTRSPRC